MTPDLNERDFEFVAHLPAGIEDRNALFSELTQHLLLPDYFGRNWDALEECLQDLRWLGVRRVLLIHETTPLIAHDERQIYFDILQTAAAHHASEQRTFVAKFPEPRE